LVLSVKIAQSRVDLGPPSESFILPRSTFGSRRHRGEITRAGDLGKLQLSLKVIL
jgi:hypothetical protein